MTPEERARIRAAFQTFIKDRMKKTGCTFKQAQEAWRKHLKDPKWERKEEYQRQHKKLMVLFQDPAFRKYLRGY